MAAYPSTNQSPNASFDRSRQSLHLLYHELRPAKSSYSYVLECAEFERHCELFARLQDSSSDSLIPRLTFDDGHTSNCDFALPILQRHGLRAHFFITAGWTGSRAGYMTWPQLRTLHAAGQIIGAHGWSHALLTHCNDAQLQHELADTRRLLEDRLSAPVTTMSLPGGRANARVLQACWNAGYTEVFTSTPRAEAVAAPPPRSIGRLNIRSGMDVAQLERILQPATGALARLERADRIKSAAKSILGDRIYAGLWALLNNKEREADPADTRA